VSVYALTFHAHYACRHSGACCTAGWSIPVEPRLLPLIGVDLLVPDAAGACTHFDGASRLCKIQREHGENMLPGACYQFPRRALIDDRGTFVALSNFCPTAAALLCESDGELAIVPSPPAFPEDRVYEGLDARGHWPPLVRPGVLFDLASYSRWETFIVSTFASGAPAGTALARIAATAERLRALRSQSPTYRASRSSARPWNRERSTAISHRRRSRRGAPMRVAGSGRWSPSCSYQSWCCAWSANARPALREERPSMPEIQTLSAGWIDR